MNCYNELWGILVCYTFIYTLHPLDMRPVADNCHQQTGMSNQNLFHLTLSSMLLLHVAVDLVYIVPISFLQWGRVSQPNLCLVILNLNAWNIMELFPRVKGIPDLAFYKRELWRLLSPDAISLVLEGNLWRVFLRHHSLNSWPRSPGLWSHSSFNMTQ